MNKTIYAEDLNYWKTGTTAAETWIEKAKREIQVAGGKVLAEGFVSDASGRAGFMLAFTFGADEFRVNWPVLKSQKGDQKAARIQAATMLYHDVKSRCVFAKVFGARTAFLHALVLPGGRTAAEATSAELLQAIPTLLLPSGKE